MKRTVIIFLTCLMLMACASSERYASMHKELYDFVREENSTIGLAVIFDGKDTIAINGNRPFPMLSVYKFPIALAFAEKCRRENSSLDMPIAVLGEDLHPDTHSPLTEKILASSATLTDTLWLPARVLLSYMLQLSDNNASDIIMKEAGGADSVVKYLAAIGASEINVASTEDEMHADQSLCYVNSTTPLAMARLTDLFDRRFNDTLSCELKNMMETSSTGTARLAAPFRKANAVIGHKTGTGFILSDGCLMAVNDVGYVHLTDVGHRYSIAVFIEHAPASLEQVEAIIARISQIVLSHLRNHPAR